MTRAPTYPIHRNRRNSISIRFSVRSIRFSRCGLRAHRPSPSRLARARRQGDTLPPSRGRVKGELALHRASTTWEAGLPLPAKAKAPGATRGAKRRAARRRPLWREKRPARARLPILPQPGAAVLSATAGLTAEFGTGSGDPRLHGLARAGRSSCGTLAAAWRPIGRSGRAGCAIGVYE